MADIVQNSQIINDGLDLVISQLRDKEKFEALLSAFLDSLQTAENDIFQIRGVQKLDNASSDMLDKWGEIVGQSRQGRTDEEYLIAIKAKIAINVSKGTIEEVASIFNMLTGATHTEVYERFPREVSLFCNADLGGSSSYIDPPFAYSGSLVGAGYGTGHYATTEEASAAYLLAIMDKVLAAGYRIGSISYLPEVAPFAYSGSAYGSGYGSGAYATSI